MIGINLSRSWCLDEKDTHGGFLGDGEKQVIYKCNKSFDINNIVKKWNKLPLSENLSIYLYGDAVKNGITYSKKGEIRFLTDKVIDKTMNETIEIVNNDIKGIIITKNFIIIVGNKNNFIYLPIDIKEKVLKVLDRYLSNIDIIYVKKD